MDYKRLCGNFEITLTAEQIAACRELEGRGLSFCVHFGYENAPDVLAEMDNAFDGGRLYEWISSRFGINAL